MTLSSNFKDLLSDGVHTCWKSPANIALVKYWGKKGHQLPANPSLSFTLTEAYTITRVAAKLNEDGKGPQVSFTFEGDKNQAFAVKIEEFLTELSPYLDYLPFVSLVIESGNNFPHSAGIASSASAMSALALALICIEQQLTDEKMDDEAFYRKASGIARLGSGSACRSVYGGYSVWGKHDDFTESSDKYAVPIDFIPGKLFEHIKDTILLVDQNPKKVSSRAGQMLMNTHPFAKARYEQAVSNLSRLKVSIRDNDWDTFAEITENEALSLHAMMMTSTPGYILMRPDTLNIVEQINKKRKQNHINVCYTLDAGPNIHLLYPEEETEKVLILTQELKQYCSGGKMIHDMIGQGPENKQCK